MAIMKPVISKHFEEMVIPFQKKISLKDFPANVQKYERYAKYSTEELDEYTKKQLKKTKKDLDERQDLLWASKLHGVLIVLQAMDTAGKDGTIKHVMQGVNPQGCRVECFKSPTAEEHAHDFLWRCAKAAPKRGEIVIFNRSHYEDVLAVKVHPEYMEALPEELSYKHKDFWQHRYDDIVAYEKHLARNGILILKFFLHISKDEQKKRLLARFDDPNKLWKISPSDVKERGFWDGYQKAYEEMLPSTSTEFAPWFVVPGNDKKVARAIVAECIAKAIDGLDLKYPTVSDEQKKQLEATKKQLLASD